MKRNRQNVIFIHKRKLIPAVLAVTLCISGCGGRGSTVSSEQLHSYLAEETAGSAESDASLQEEMHSVSESLETPSAAEEPEKTEEPEGSTGNKETEPEINREELLSQLLILQDPRFYTYQNMLEDTELLLQLYPDLVTQDSIDTTADGRMLMHYVIGNPDAPKQIFINGAIHAREYLTFQLVMKQMCVYLEHIRQNDSWEGLDYQTMWDQVAVHVVPLVNPDGVQISQFGLDGLQNEEVRNGIQTLAANDGTAVTTSYLDHWKANASGVDLNRNFDAYWESYEGTGYPSSDHYKGTAPGSEPESAALIRLTEEQHFLYTISYHTQGHVIY